MAIEDISDVGLRMEVAERQRRAGEARQTARAIADRVEVRRLNARAAEQRRRSSTPRAKQG